jgi:SAM-dependent methyltransferase
MNPSPEPSLINRGFQGDDEILTEYAQIKLKYREEISDKPDPLLDNKLRDIYSEKKEGHLLDIGCSFGDFLRKASYFYEVAGVEVNPLTADIASQEFVVFRDYLQNLNLKQEYDIATLHQILFGVPDPSKLFTEIHKVLKKDGILYVNTPNSDSYVMACYHGKSNHLYGYATQNVFNHKSLAALAEKTGFKIRSFRTEWLDIYITDLLVCFDTPEEFIHKRNSNIPNYEDLIQREEDFQKNLGIDLGNRGNYLVAVLEKA